MEEKIAHLEMIQGVISRMAENSLRLKEWSVGIVSALMAIAVTTKSTKVVLIGFLPAIVFYLLDAYYLRLERCFRELYDNVRVKDSSCVDFYMNFDGGSGLCSQKWWDSWLSSLFSFATAPFHIVIVIAILIARCVIS